MKFVISAFAVVVVAATSGCTAQSFCNKVAQCLDEEEDIQLEDDSTAVCVEEFNGGINALRANEEDDCQKLADAQIALANCAVGLDCDDFLAPEFDGECDDEQDNLRDAQDDADGTECTAQD